MRSLVRTEWLKMRKYNAFWWVMGITALSYPGIIYIFFKGYEDFTNKPSQANQIAKMALGNPFSFPEAWHTIAFAASCFVFIPAVVSQKCILTSFCRETRKVLRCGALSRPL